MPEFPEEPEIEPDDLDETDTEITLTSILVCRRARYGCTATWSYQPGGEQIARRIRLDHEQYRCLFRHLPA